MKVATIIGTRPEIIRLSCIMSRFEEVFDHTLIHTGQNYDHELNQIFFDELGIKSPDYYLNVAENEQDVCGVVGNVISSSYKVLKEIQPEAVLILGDTNSCLSAYAAKRLKIPVFHLEAGNRCFDDRVPEEINRKIVDHISDINMTYSERSREYLMKEGFPPDRVIKVGSPMFEVIHRHKRQFIIGKKYNEKSIFNKLCEQGINVSHTAKYFLFSVHREENVENNLEKFIALLLDLKRTYKDTKMIVSTHPRTKKALHDAGWLESLKNELGIHFLTPFSFKDYLELQSNAEVVLSDSGTIFEESSILGFNAINLRETHERPEASEEMPVIMTGMDYNRVIEAIKLFKSKSNKKLYCTVADYRVPNVSEKVTRILLSYTDYVNRNVWKWRK